MKKIVIVALDFSFSISPHLTDPATVYRRVDPQPCRPPSPLPPIIRAHCQRRCTSDKLVPFILICNSRRKIME